MTEEMIKITCKFVNDNHDRYFVKVDETTFNNLNERALKTTVKVWENGKFLTAHIGEIAKTSLKQPEKGKFYECVLLLKHWQYGGNEGLRSTLFVMKANKDVVEEENPKFDATSVLAFYKD